MCVSSVLKSLNPSALISWKSTGKLQQTVCHCVERNGLGLHSGSISTVKIIPSAARSGRLFIFRSNIIPASIENVVRETPLCTTLSKNGYTIRTVEHLLSALEASGVDNCLIEIDAPRDCGRFVEVPILDGSAREWIAAINQSGLKDAVDMNGETFEKFAPYLTEPFQVTRNDSFITAFPHCDVKITYGIDFPQAPIIGCQWFSSTISASFYSEQIASCRTFCIYEEVESMRKSGLIKGGSVDVAIICSVKNGWLNPPLRFNDESCRHKVLDFIGDMSLLAQDGSQGLVVAHFVVYKGGHSLHAEFLRSLLGNYQTLKS